MITRRQLAGGIALSGCLSSALARDAAKPLFPDVLAVKVQSRGQDRFDFDVTISSPYDTPERYADAFRVQGEGGQVFGERVLLHDHADEQPFTRSLTGVLIPPGIRLVSVQGRDRIGGYGGRKAEVLLPGR